MPEWNRSDASECPSSGKTTGLTSQLRYIITSLIELFREEKWNGKSIMRDDQQTVKVKSSVCLHRSTIIRTAKSTTPGNTFLTSINVEYLDLD